MRGYRPKNMRSGLFESGMKYERWDLTWTSLWPRQLRRKRWWRHFQRCARNFGVPRCLSMPGKHCGTLKTLICCVLGQAKAKVETGFRFFGDLIANQLGSLFSWVVNCIVLVQYSNSTVPGHCTIPFICCGILDKNKNRRHLGPLSNLCLPCETPDDHSKENLPGHWSPIVVKFTKMARGVKLRLILQMFKAPTHSSSWALYEIYRVHAT